MDLQLRISIEIKCKLQHDKAFYSLFGQPKKISCQMKGIALSHYLSKCKQMRRTVQTSLRNPNHFDFKNSLESALTHFVLCIALPSYS